jgi:hypothetical protein
VTNNVLEMWYRYNSESTYGGFCSSGRASQEAEMACGDGSPHTPVSRTGWGWAAEGVCTRVIQGGEDGRWGWANAKSEQRCDESQESSLPHSLTHLLLTHSLTHLLLTHSLDRSHSTNLTHSSRSPSHHGEPVPFLTHSLSLSHPHSFLPSLTLTLYVCP